MIKALPYAAIGLIVIAAAVQVFRVGDDDPEWEARWRSLSQIKDALKTQREVAGETAAYVRSAR